MGTHCRARPSFQPTRRFKAAEYGENLKNGSLLWQKSLHMSMNPEDTGIHFLERLFWLLSMTTAFQNLILSCTFNLQT